MRLSSILSLSRMAWGVPAVAAFPACPSIHLRIALFRKGRYLIEQWRATNTVDSEAANLTVVNQICAGDADEPGLKCRSSND